jgi:hypothetical protein
VQNPRRTGEDEKARASRIEDGADLHTAEESQEGIHSKDPSDAARAVLFQLVALDIGLECANRVDQPERSEQAQETAEYYQPGLGSAFGVDVALCVCRDSTNGISANRPVRRRHCGRCAIEFIIWSSWRLFLLSLLCLLGRVCLGLLLIRYMQSRILVVGSMRLCRRHILTRSRNGVMSMVTGNGCAGRPGLGGHSTRNEPLISAYGLAGLISAFI